MSVYATRTEPGQEAEFREFTDIVWKNIPSVIDSNGTVVLRDGWREVSKPQDTPEAALAAQAKAEADKIANVQKQAALSEARKKSLIESVEAKIKLGTQDFDFANELKPYLEATDRIKALGNKRIPEIVTELRKEILK